VFYNGVARPRDEHASDETRQKTKRPKKNVPENPFRAALGYQRSQPPAERTNRHSSYGAQDKSENHDY
jgi:hypothetical protein